VKGKRSHPLPLGPQGSRKSRKPNALCARVVQSRKGVDIGSRVGVGPLRVWSPRARGGTRVPGNPVTPKRLSQAAPIRETDQAAER
jgi:hypothetical protein